MKKQDLLYLTTSGTSPVSPILSILLVQNGQVQSMPKDADEWPYQFFLDAINDGWRVVKFPEQSLLLSEERSYGLGCEYVLEKINEVE